MCVCVGLLVRTPVSIVRLSASLSVGLSRWVCVTTTPCVCVCGLPSENFGGYVCANCRFCLWSHLGLHVDLSLSVAMSAFCDFLCESFSAFSFCEFVLV